MNKLGFTGYVRRFVKLYEDKPSEDISVNDSVSQEIAKQTPKQVSIMWNVNTQNKKPEVHASIYDLFSNENGSEQHLKKTISPEFTSNAEKLKKTLMNIFKYASEHKKIKGVVDIDTGKNILEK